MASYLDIALPIVEKDENGEFIATHYFEDYLHQIIKATGGEGAAIITKVLTSALLADIIPHLSGQVQTLKKKVGHLEAALSTHVMQAEIRKLQLDTALFNTKIERSDYTCKNKDYREGRSGITFKLPENAKRNDEVMIANGDGSTITVDGNGNNIKYTSTDTKLIMRRKGTSFHFHFFEDNALNERYWRAR